MRFEVRNLRLLLILITLNFKLITLNCLAQTIYPVTTNFSITPPYSVYLSNNVVSGFERFKVNLVFNDFNEPSTDVRLKITISNNQVFLETPENYRPNPINLFPGSNEIGGNILTPYLNYNNLNASGINKQDLLQSGSLPEGFYTICIEALDYNTGLALAAPACGSALFVKNNPPISIYPACGSTVPARSSQNILFQWQPYASLAIQTNYEITLVQVPEQINPNDAINSANTPLLDDELSLGTSFYYGPEQIQLEIGETYAYRIKASDANGVSIFENDGLNEVCWFNYGVDLKGGNIPLAKPKDKSFVAIGTPIFKWQGPDNAPMGEPINYSVKIVEQQVNQSGTDAIAYNTPFYEETFEEIPHAFGYEFALEKPLEEGKQYAWEVSAIVYETPIAKSAVRTFTAGTASIYAGDHIIAISDITNPDLKNYTGQGKLKIFEDTAEYLVDFNALNIKNVAGKMVLEGGEILYPFRNKTINLIENGNPSDLKFSVKQARLNKSGLELQGYIKNEFSLDQANGDTSFVLQTKDQWVDFNSYKLNGQVLLGENIDLDIAENIKLKVLENAAYVISDNEVSVEMSGQAITKDYITNFTKADQFEYITENILNTPYSVGYYKSITIAPKNAIIDFSSKKSPGQFVTQNDWKGVYFESFKINHQKDVEFGGKLSYNKLIQPEFNSNATGWIDGEGLNCSAETNYQGIGKYDVNYTECHGTLTKLKLEIVKDEIKDSYILGYAITQIKGETIKEENKYTFKVPISNKQEDEAYLDLESIYCNGHEAKLDRTTTYIKFEDGKYVFDGGTASVKVFKEGDELYVGECRSVALENHDQMNSGTVRGTLKEKYIELDNEDQGYTEFIPGFFRLYNARGLELHGRVWWSFPIAIKDSSAIASSKTVWFDFNNKKITGKVEWYSHINKTYELVDPLDYTVKLDGNYCYYDIKDSKVKLNFGGSIFLPEKIKTADGRRMELRFRNADKVTYIKTDQSVLTGLSNTFRPADQTDISITPQICEAYFADDSPLKDNIKGVKLTTYALNLGEKLDSKGRFVFSHQGHAINPQFPSEDEKTKMESTLYLTASGFQGNVTYKNLKERELNNRRMRLHEFLTWFTDLSVTFEDNIVSEGVANGYIPLRVMNNKPIRYQVPLTNYGFQPASLIDLDDGSGMIVYDEDKTYRNSTLTIKKGEFKSTDKLRTTIDLDFDEYGLKVRNMPGFDIWSDGEVGFYDQRDQQADLEEPIDGKLLDLFDLTIDRITASRINNVYRIGFNAIINMAENLSGYYLEVGPSGAKEIKNGPTRISVVSLSGNDPKFTSERGFSRMGVNFDVILAQAAAEGQFYVNDPEWGTCFKAYGLLGMMLPVDFYANAKFILGKKDGYSYWFAQAGLDVETPTGTATGDIGPTQKIKNKYANKMNKEKGAKPVKKVKEFLQGKVVKNELTRLGIPFGPMRILGGEIRVYHHMRHDFGNAIMNERYSIDQNTENVGPDITNAAYIPDGGVEGGAYLRLTMVDGYTMGFDHLIEGAIEVNGLQGGINEVAMDIKWGIKNYYLPAFGYISTLRGKGKFYYNRPDRRFFTSLQLESGTPNLCVDAIGVFTSDPYGFRLTLGSFERRILVKPGCFGFSPTGWLDVTQNYFELGLGIDLGAYFYAPWIDIGIVKVKPYAYAYLAGGGAGKAVFSPGFNIPTLYFWADASAGISCKYKYPDIPLPPVCWFTCTRRSWKCAGCCSWGTDCNYPKITGASGTWSLASARLTGNLGLRKLDSSPEMFGTLNGYVTVVGQGVSFGLEVDQKLY